MKHEAGEEIEVREPLLFINPSNGVYYLRKRVGKGDTTVSLRTTRLSVARQLREDYWAAIRAQKLGLVPTPAPAQAPAPPQSQATGITPVLPPVAPAASQQGTKEPQREPDKPEPPPLFDTVGEVIRFYGEHGYLTEGGPPRSVRKLAFPENG